MPLLRRVENLRGLEAAAVVGDEQLEASALRVRVTVTVQGAACATALRSASWAIR